MSHSGCPWLHSNGVTDCEWSWSARVILRPDTGAPALRGRPSRGLLPDPLREVGRPHGGPWTVARPVTCAPRRSQPTRRGSSPAFVPPPTGLPRARSSSRTFIRERRKREKKSPTGACARAFALRAVWAGHQVDRNHCDALSITGRREVTRSANPRRRCRPGRGGAHSSLPAPATIQARRRDSRASTRTAPHRTAPAPLGTKRLLVVTRVARGLRRATAGRISRRVSLSLVFPRSVYAPLCLRPPDGSVASDERGQFVQKPPRPRVRSSAFASRPPGG